MDKKNIRLAIILSVLVIAAYIYKVPYQEWRQENSRPKNFLSGVKVSDAEKIEISREGNVTALERENGGWIIADTKGLSAKSDLADALVNGLEQAIDSEVELVSDNKDKKADYDTDDDCTIIKLFSGNGEELAVVAVGKPKDAESTFISSPAIDNTYAVKANFADVVSASDWRDMTIFAVDKEKINRIRFQYPASEFTVDKEGDKWAGILPYKFSVNKDKLSKTLEIMTNLQAAAIPEQKFEGTGLEKHEIIIQASGEEINNVLMVGSKDKDGRYFAKKGDTDVIYLITEEQRNELLKKITQLR